MNLKIIPIILALTCLIFARPQDGGDEDYDYYDYYNDNELDAKCSAFADKKEPELQ